MASRRNVRPGTFALVAAAGCVAAFAGCKQYDSPSTQTSPPDEASRPPSQATGAPGPVPSNAMPQAPGNTTAGLGVADSTGHGTYLADAAGRALYALEEDGNGQSSCNDACTTRWPPLLAPGAMPKSLDGSIQADAIGSIQRSDGTVQVTYRGHPLYRYSQDAAAGQAQGQGIKDQFGEWTLLSPSGQPLQTD